MVKEITFLQPVRLTVAATRRHAPALGSEGGGDGSLARDQVAKPGAPFRPLRSGESVDIASGGRVRIATPGGGGWKKKGPDT